MKQLIKTLLLCALPAIVCAQRPVELKKSDAFEIPWQHKPYPPISFAEKGILQVSEMRLKSFNFQWFTNDLKFVKEKTVEPKDRLSDRANSPRFIKVGDKAYLFVRDVYRERATEGVSCLEFDLDQFDFVKEDKKLFESSSKVAFNMFRNNTASFEDDNNITFGLYKMDISKNSKTVLFTYRLVPENRKEKENHDVIGMHLFDANMNKLWGGEMKMPYPEAKMDNLSFIVSDDAKVYILTRVYDGERPTMASSTEKTNFHLELLIYGKDSPEPEIVKINLENLVTVNPNLFETFAGEILLGGFYTKLFSRNIEGAFVLQLDKVKKTTSIKNGGLFEIPSEIIKSFSSAREMRGLERKENRDDEHDIGVDHLMLRSIYVIDDGRIILSAEQYHIEKNISLSTSASGRTNRETSYKTFADDIYIINASPDGKSWVRKIPKKQISDDASGAELSFNTIFANDNIYYFYIDNKKNLNLPTNEAPSKHVQGRGGYLVSVSYDKEGNMTKHLLGEKSDFHTSLYVRYFVRGAQDNLIYSAGSQKRKKLVSLQLK